VALFVDGDNLKPPLADPILNASGRLGRVDGRRVYGASNAIRAWEGAAGYRAIQVGGAKNGTDLLLCIEAVELACKGGFDAFVLASDDRDFSHLAHWLRERGFHVLGLGTAKSPSEWRAACSAFKVLETQAASPVGSLFEPAPKAAILSEADARIRDLIRAEGESGNLLFSRLGGRLWALHKMRPSTVNAADWRTYIEARSSLYELDPKGPDARLRWRGT
jgi:hypothetical protein